MPLVTSSSSLQRNQWFHHSQQVTPDQLLLQQLSPPRKINSKLLVDLVYQLLVSSVLLMLSVPNTCMVLRELVTKLPTLMLISPSLQTLYPSSTQLNQRKKPIPSSVPHLPSSSLPLVPPSKPPTDPPSPWYSRPKTSVRTHSSSRPSQQLPLSYQRQEKPPASLQLDSPLPPSLLPPSTERINE